MKPSLAAKLALQVLLAERRVKICDLARICRCKTGTLYNTLSGNGQSPRIIAALEKWCGLPLWTDPSRMVEISTGGPMKISVPAIQAIQMERGMRLLNESGAQTVTEMMAVLAKAAPKTSIIPQGEPSAEAPCSEAAQD